MKDNDSRQDHDGETYEDMMARHAREQRARDEAWSKWFAYHGIEV